MTGPQCADDDDRLVPGSALVLRDPPPATLTSPDQAWAQVELSPEDCAGATSYATRRICGVEYRLFLASSGPIYAQPIAGAP